MKRRVFVMGNDKHKKGPSASSHKATQRTTNIIITAFEVNTTGGFKSLD